MSLRIAGISSGEFERLRAGGVDANGQRPLVRVAEGGASPCRHCLGLIRDGEEKLVLAYRPFAEAQPYAEVGPIFLHARACERYDAAVPPAWFAFLDPAPIRGYGHDDWIRYETGKIVRGSEIAAECGAILAEPSIAYVHVRSKYGCFQCRVDRAA
jgi:hypothetical protein